MSHWRLEEWRKAKAEYEAMPLTVKYLRHIEPPVLPVPDEDEIESMPLADLKEYLKVMEVGGTLTGGIYLTAAYCARRFGGVR